MFPYIYTIYDSHHLADHALATRPIWSQPTSKSHPRAECLMNVLRLHKSQRSRHIRQQSITHRQTHTQFQTSEGKQQFVSFLPLKSLGVGFRFNRIYMYIYIERKRCVTEGFALELPHHHPQTSNAFN